MGKAKQQTLEELSSELIAYLKTLSYSANRVRQYRTGIKQLDQFMKNGSAEYYSPVIGMDFITSILGNRPYHDLSRWDKDNIRCVNALNEYQATGTIKFRSVTKNYEFPGEFGSLILDFIEYRQSLGMAKDTLDSNKLYLHRFLEYLHMNHITDVSNLENRHILGFVNSLGLYTKPTVHCTLSSLRNFLRYLYDKHYTNVDLAYLVPKDSYKKEAKLPTTYTEDEVERLIGVVDRSSPKGKRDVAMILLAARLGLRASDICGLKFENIHWENNTIVLTQKKTDQRIELPLLEEIGNAIIDYLKYGRPISYLPYVFIRIGQPYSRMAEATLHSIVSFYLRRAGIEHVTEKKHGPHALRHSLAGVLLEQKIPLPVIAEVLGHTNTESTMSYLRIDLESLRQCAIEVPPLSSDFYGRRCFK